MSVDDPRPGETRQQWADRMLSDWQAGKNRDNGTISASGMVALHRTARGTCAGSILARKMIEAGIGEGVVLPN